MREMKIPTKVCYIECKSINDDNPTKPTDLFNVHSVFVVAVAVQSFFFIFHFILIKCNCCFCILFNDIFSFFLFLSVCERADCAQFGSVLMQTVIYDEMKRVKKTKS